jgi:hypothetical protein
MTDTYCYLQLRGQGRDAAALKTALAEAAGAWRQAGITIWGVWEGLFGIASNELIVVAAASGERPESDFSGPLAGDAVSIRDSLLLAPTVRPEGTAPCQMPGLYVFRFFEVASADVAEVAELSRQAWETFENADSYQSAPQGLFRPVDQRIDSGRMLLVTWYDGLESWQTSRAPDPAAVENFKRRRALTSGTLALATRLITPFA